MRTTPTWTAGWPCTTQQAASVDTGQVITLTGDHYLHHTLSPEIAADTTEFLAALSIR